MKRPQFTLRLPLSLLAAWHRHRMMIALLFALSVIAASSQFLGADLIGGPSSSDGPATSSDDEELRICASVGTVFDGMTSLTQVMKTFKDGVSAVIQERETLLSDSSLWQCLPDVDGNSDPPMQALQALAESMPGWHIRNPDGGTQLRPVTFVSLPSIVGEFEREYECKLAEFQDDAFRTVYVDRDLPAPTGFDQTDADFAIRLPVFHELQKIERQRARVALERTIQTLKSFEVSYTYAKQLLCFQRASLDLKNELTLLADTTSCMPKIWDALTSIHDRKAAE